MAYQYDGKTCADLFRQWLRGRIGEKTAEGAEVLAETMEGKRPLPPVGGVLGPRGIAILRRGVDYHVIRGEPPKPRIIIRRGRRPERNQAEKKAIVDRWYTNPALQQEMSQEQYCNEVGIDASTLRRWRKEIYGD